MTPIDSDDVLAGRARFGKALRDLGHSFAGHHSDAALLNEAAQSLEELTASFDSGEIRRRDPSTFGDHRRYNYEQGPIGETYPDRPISGNASPWGLDTEIHREGDDIVAYVTLRAAHEGAPGRSHGGGVSALFDDIFGFVQGVVDITAFTGQLTVTYRAGTPLDTRLACRVRAGEQSGRKVIMTGELTVVETGQLVAEANAIFITVDREVLVNSMRNTQIET